MKTPLCDAHCKELLRFLLLKTAAVRSGIKPGELLLVRSCYRSRPPEHPACRLYRREILRLLELEHLELRRLNDGALILFFHPAAMRTALTRPENRRLLTDLGYPVEADSPKLLSELRRRFSIGGIPHEVGVFLGYPAKDVSGFIDRRPRIPIRRGRWAVFGDVGESLRRMNLYRRMEEEAENILDSGGDLRTFFDRVTRLNPSPAP